MDERTTRLGFEGDAVAGRIIKAANLSAGDATEEDLKAINKYTLTPLKAEDVFTFKAVLCDNDVDRDFERFSLKALQDLQKLFLGKTVIKNHVPAAENQVARIYRTELQQSNKTLKSGELYTQLVAHCYMVKTAGNADLIAEIKGGIKKEGSVGCAMSSVICSICGTDNTKSHCSHFRGRSYNKDGGSEVCTFILNEAKDAYEFSLVAVPAQPKAGVSKNYTGKTIYEEQTPGAGESPETTQADEEKAKAFKVRLRMSGRLTPPII